MVVTVLDGNRSTYKYRRELRDRGFRYCSEPTPHWFRECSEEELPEIEDWCFKKRLRIIIPFNERNANYRKDFYETNPGNYKPDKYLCAYCGRILPKEKVSVDHLISVNKSQTSRFYLNLLRKLGFESVNDVRNLVPSCGRCNSRKGAKGGRWVLKGYSGRFKWFWFAVWILRLCILCASVFAAWWFWNC